MIAYLIKELTYINFENPLGGMLIFFLVFLISIAIATTATMFIFKKTKIVKNDDDIASTILCGFISFMLMAGVMLPMYSKSGNLDNMPEWKNYSSFVKPIHKNYKLLSYDDTQVTVKTSDGRTKTFNQEYDYIKHDTRIKHAYVSFSGDIPKRHLTKTESKVFKILNGQELVIHLPQK